MKIAAPLLSERYDVFDVEQVTRSTTLESQVAVDLVNIDAGMESQTHRHNKADTVLLILSGQGEVHVGTSVFSVKGGERIHIPPGTFHKVITGENSMRFLSIQSPPILVEEGELDLEFECEGIKEAI